MQKMFMFLLASILCSVGYTQEPLQDKVFFANSLMMQNYFYSDVSYKSPSWIRNSNRKLTVSPKNFTPGNSLELEYVSAVKGSWQAKVFYHPVRGIDFFKRATHLVFWLYAESETDVNELPGVAISDKDKEPSSFLPLQPYLARYQKGQWLRVAIPIKNFSRPLDVTALNTVVFAQPSSGGSEPSAPKLHRLYIDQIELWAEAKDQAVKTTPQLISAEGFEKHVDIVWPAIKDANVKYVKIYRSDDNKTFQSVGIQSPFIYRYADYTDAVDKKFYYKITYLDEHTRNRLFQMLSAPKRRR